MSRYHGAIQKWCAYAGGLLLILFLEQGILHHISLRGAVPLLVPVMVAMVAMFEGALPGSCFGLAAGALGMFAYYRAGPVMPLCLAVAGMACGAFIPKVMGCSLWSGYLCSALALLITECFQILAQMVLGGGGQITVLLRLAAWEGLYSLALTIVVYFPARWIYCRFSAGWDAESLL